MNVVKPIVSFLGQCRREAGGSWRLRIHMNIPYQRVVALSRHDLKIVESARYARKTNTKTYKYILNGSKRSID